MSTEVFTTIMGVMLAVLGGTGFWGYRQSRKEAPVKKAEAEVAIAEKSQQMALAIATRLDQDVKTLRGDLATANTNLLVLTGRVDEQGTQLREQESTINHLRDAVRIFSDAWDDLILRWDTHRQSTTAPAKPGVHRNT